MFTLRHLYCHQPRKMEIFLLEKFFQIRVFDYSEQRTSSLHAIVYTLGLISLSSVTNENH